MNKRSTWLLDYKADFHSQGGEDGVIEKILDMLPNKDRWCVEFGAWDGRHLSTTCHLIESKGYSAVLIESDKSRFEQLLKNHADHNIIAINQLVGFGQDDKLDSILERTPIPKHFDFLSIDIDGNDYHVWQAVAAYTPKLICIEFNPTIPNEVHFVQAADASVTQGCSLSALVRLAKIKGYELVAVLHVSAFFVQREYLPVFEIEDNRPEVLRDNLEDVTYLFSGYDGKIMLSGSRKLPWHDLKLETADFQVLPQFLRKFPGHYSKWQHRMFSFLKEFRRFSRRQ